MFLNELNLYNYKARVYSPMFGRFLQTDPAGYADGVNWYNYVHGDPVNGADPTGLDAGTVLAGVTVTAMIENGLQDLYRGTLSNLFNRNGGSSNSDPGTRLSEVVVTARRPAKQNGAKRSSSSSNSCLPASNLLTHIANGADDISNLATAVSLLSGGAALLTSETIVGAVTFGSISGVSGGISLAASGAGAFFNVLGGRPGNAAADAFSVAFGGAAAKGAKSLPKAVQFIRGGAATVVTQAASTICPG